MFFLQLLSVVIVFLGSVIQVPDPLSMVRWQRTITYTHHENVASQWYLDRQVEVACDYQRAHQSPHPLCDEPLILTPASTTASTHGITKDVVVYDPCLPSRFAEFVAAAWRVYYASGELAADIGVVVGDYYRFKTGAAPTLGRAAMLEDRVVLALVGHWVTIARDTTRVYGFAAKHWASIILPRISDRALLALAKRWYAAALDFIGAVAASVEAGVTKDNKTLDVYAFLAGYVSTPTVMVTDFMSQSWRSLGDSLDGYLSSSAEKNEEFKDWAQGSIEMLEGHFRSYPVVSFLLDHPVSVFFGRVVYLLYLTVVTYARIAYKITYIVVVFALTQAAIAVKQLVLAILPRIASFIYAIPEWYERWRLGLAGLCAITLALRAFHRKVLRPHGYSLSQSLWDIANWLWALGERLYAWAQSPGGQLILNEVRCLVGDLFWVAVDLVRLFLSLALREWKRTVGRWYRRNRGIWRYNIQRFHATWNPLSRAWRIDRMDRLTGLKATELILAGKMYANRRTPFVVWHQDYIYERGILTLASVLRSDQWLTLQRWKRHATQELRLRRGLELLSRWLPFWYKV
ncbi:hypothetical protein K490DRAFT_53299 [Saccharata proteae CBS 121410]|uniref:Uncharacterized protein n=1 Tax=Saccharata proteae CBS 121410 TaxID=1314787 RepID=A0A9P4M3S4_9PEZI|nr:hypothetical protein K490DRAFT_53299 [Saccharata proteae CBS 121410]